MNRFEIGRLKRQKVLDALHANKGGMRACKIAQALNIQSRKVGAILQNMREFREVIRVGDLYFPMAETAALQNSANKPKGSSNTAQVASGNVTILLPGASRIYRFGALKARPTDSRRGEHGRVSSIMDMA